MKVSNKYVYSPRLFLIGIIRLLRLSRASSIVNVIDSTMRIKKREIRKKLIDNMIRSQVLKLSIN